MGKAGKPLPCIPYRIMLIARACGKILKVFVAASVVQWKTLSSQLSIITVMISLPDMHRVFILPRVPCG